VVEGKGVEDVGEDSAFEDDPVGEALGGEVRKVDGCVDTEGFPVDTGVNARGKLRRGEWAELEGLVGRQVVGRGMLGVPQGRPP